MDIVDHAGDALLWDAVRGHADQDVAVGVAKAENRRDVRLELVRERGRQLRVDGTDLVPVQRGTELT